MSRSSLTLTYETQTPIYTGGAEMTFDRLHETGLMGGLRWWYEVFVRGVGGDACDPSAHNCLHDPGKPHDGICDACRVFGATGWRRRFRLVADDSRLRKANDLDRVVYADAPYRKEGSRGWRWPRTPHEGRLSLSLVSLDDAFDVQIIAALLQFMADYAALGSKDQFGLGLARQTGQRIDPAALCAHLVALTPQPSPAYLPALNNVFLAAIETRTNRLEEMTTLRARLRALFRTGPLADRTLRHFVMGTLGPDAIGSKVNVSLPVDNRIRLTGWLPREHRAYGHHTREEVVEAIYDTLKAAPYSLVYWREFNTPRDTITPNEADRLAFAKQLLGCSL